MKPTLEQVQEWRAMAYRYADKQTGDYNEADEIAQEKFAELAAQWGRQAAQHEAENAPWLTTAHVICTDAGIAHGPISGRLEALRDKIAEQAQQTTEETDAEMAIKSHYVAAEEPELPEAVAWRFVDDEEVGYTAYQTAPPTPEQATYLKKWNRPAWEPLFTAVQMHDHFQAGVRAGMAQSQDAKLEPLVREALRKAFSFGQRYWQQADSEYVSHHKKSDETQRKFLALIEETIAAMKGDQK